MAIQINFLEEVLDILQLVGVEEKGVDYDGVLDWLYENTGNISGFLLGKYRTTELTAGDITYEDMAELIVEALDKE